MTARRRRCEHCGEFQARFMTILFRGGGHPVRWYGCVHCAALLVAHVTAEEDVARVTAQATPPAPGDRSMGVEGDVALW